MSGFDKNEIPMPLREGRSCKIALPEWLENMSEDDDNDVMSDAPSVQHRAGNAGNQTLRSASLSNSSFDDSVSEFGSEQHSYVDKRKQQQRKNPRPNNKQARRPTKGDDDGSQAMEDNGCNEDGDIIDNLDKDTKFEKMINYKGKDLSLSKVLGGEYMKTSAKQKKMIEDFNNMNCNDDGEDGCNLQDKNTYKNMIDDLMDCDDANDEDNDQFINNKDDDDDEDDDDNDERIRNKIKKHMGCRLCKHTSVRFSDMDPDFVDAYKDITRLDREKVCFAHDPEIFNQMTMLFNTKQRFVKKNGGYHFFVTPEEIMTHFKYHDTSNPLRPLNELLLEAREIRRRGRKYLFGKANGQKYWNQSKTKMYFMAAKQEQTLINNIAILRSQMLMGLDNDHGLFRGSGNKADISKPSRHMTSGGKKGKFSLEFSR